ncbi:MAG: RNA polymerase sigma factor [Mesonia hippocampi]|uniref:RNA polymerase sigma factor n=1 Tax=Mesonia hippocampi TaxID=1628250 RepID=UPI003F97FDAC
MGIKLQEQIQLARQGNQKAYKYLLDLYWQDVYTFQVKRIQNRYLAEEVTIQTFSRAFDKLDTYNPKYSFKTWLITISKNIHIDIIRKKEVEITSVDKATQSKIADETPTAEDKLINEQNLKSLLQHIKKLQSHYKEIIHLRFFKELSYKEIAKVIDEPVNNVKVKLLRAKKLLAEEIKNSTQER